MIISIRWIVAGLCIALVSCKGEDKEEVAKIKALQEELNIKEEATLELKKKVAELEDKLKKEKVADPTAEMIEVEKQIAEVKDSHRDFKQQLAQLDAAKKRALKELENYKSTYQIQE